MHGGFHHAALFLHFRNSGIYVHVISSFARYHAVFTAVVFQLSLPSTPSVTISITSIATVILAYLFPKPSTRNLNITGMPGFCVLELSHAHTEDLCANPGLPDFLHLPFSSLGRCEFSLSWDMGSSCVGVLVLGWESLGIRGVRLALASKVFL